MSKESDALPKFVYPCGKKYSVSVELMDPEDYGETLGIEKMIKINSDPKKKKSVWETLFHEYLHGVLHSSGLTHLLPSGPGEVNLEEAIVSAFEEHLFHMIDVDCLGKKP